MQFKSGKEVYYKKQKVIIIKMPSEETPHEKGNAVYVRPIDSNETFSCSLSDLSISLE